MANTETILNEFVINQLSKTKYEELKTAGTLQENQLYMVDEAEETSSGVSSIGGITGDIILGDGLSIDGTTLKLTGGAGSGASIDDTQLSDTTTYSSNKINSTYLPLSGGTLTGSITIPKEGDSYTHSLNFVNSEAGISLLKGSSLWNEIRLQIRSGYFYRLMDSAFTYYFGGGQPDLGEPSKKWKNLYLSGNISDGTNTVAVSEIAKKTEIPNIVVSSTEPTNPQENDIWISVG